MKNDKKEREAMGRAKSRIEAITVVRVVECLACVKYVIFGN